MTNHKDIRSPAVSSSPPRPLSHSPTLPLSTSSAAHTIMFWVLSGMAVAVFAPCVLVPIWVEVEGVREYERAMGGVVADLQAAVDRNEARIDALRTDPLVNQRIARRELNYRPQGEQVVRWSTDEMAALRLPASGAVSPTETEPAVEKPPWAQALVRWLPALPWRDLFVRSANRSLLLLMAGGLLVAAFLLYGRTSSVRISGTS